jgi:hypothetical protein
MRSCTTRHLVPKADPQDRQLCPYYGARCLAQAPVVLRGSCFAFCAILCPSVERWRLKETIMGSTKSLFRLLIATSLIATAGPVMAKREQKPQQTAKTTQNNKSAGKSCVITAPPFMRNPRFMNRGFFKKKCKTK